MPRASIKTPSILSTLLLLGLAFSLISREPQADPRLKHKLTEIVVPAHYDSDGELIEAHREVIEVVQ